MIKTTDFFTVSKMADKSMEKTVNMCEAQCQYLFHTVLPQLREGGMDPVRAIERVGRQVEAYRAKVFAAHRKRCKTWYRQMRVNRKNSSERV